MLKGLYILGDFCYDTIYPESLRREFADLVEIVGPQLDTKRLAANRHLLRDIDVLLSGWGAPVIDADFLRDAPNLKVVLYGAGSVRGLVTDALWERRIVLTNANNANGAAVAEYTLASILFAGKHVLNYVDASRRSPGRHGARRDGAGNFHSTVGLISLGQVGQRVARLLQPFDRQVIAYDPFASPAMAAELGVELVDLATLCATADVVSLHAPNLPETKNMLTAAHFASMRPNATFINTARGAIVHEPGMIEVLQNRPDLTAILDVTDPEPPVSGSPLWTLPNVFLTPHVAGSIGPECARHGYQMLDELQRYVAGEPLRFQITRERFAIMA